jgi:multiple sugar transport system permease protein
MASLTQTEQRPIADITIHGFWSIPQTISLDKFGEAWKQAHIRQYLLNSFIITIPSLIGMLFFSSLSAYALARFRFKGNLFVYFIYVGGTMLPFQILLLPVFRLTNALGMYDTYGALIIIHIAFQLGFCTFVMRNFMRTVPSEILDAARVDGCGEFRIYWQIMLPLSLPSLAALATLEFTWVFNDFLWALILLQSDSLRPVTAGLATLRGQYVTDWPLITAGALLATLPTVIVFVFLQRYFIQGLTLGSGK